MKLLGSPCFRIAGAAFGALWVTGPCAPCPAQTSAPVTVQPAIIQAETDGRVWGALVYASDAPSTSPGLATEWPKDCKDLPRRLGKAFPYRHFQVIGQHTQDIFRQYESWVVPSRELFLKIDSKGQAEHGGMNLHLQFWQEQQVLVKTDAVLLPQSPLFIAGPRWKEGRLIFVLLLRGSHGT